MYESSNWSTLVVPKLNSYRIIKFFFWRIIADFADFSAIIATLSMITASIRKTNYKII